MAKYNSGWSARVYEGDANYTTLHADSSYDCFVEFPVGYYYRPSRYEWLVSPDPIDGFLPSPGHDMGNGEVLTSFAHTEYDLSSGFRSRPDVVPLSEQTIAQFMAGCVNRGMYLRSIGAHNWINMLRLIKQKDLNSQKVNGYGCNEGNAKMTMTDNIKGLDGYRTSVDANACVRTLGIQNFYGNVWDFIHNCLVDTQTVYIKQDPRFSSHPSSAADAINQGWKASSAKVPYNVTSGSYMNSIAFDSNIPYLTHPVSAGGNEYNPIGDYFSTDTNRPFSVVRLGGNAWDGLRDGSFAWASDSPLSVSGGRSGAAACIYG